MLDSKEISAVELTEQYLDRIENSDKEINSYITVCKENALADAKKAQEVIDSGNSGAFTGLPISVKDNICTLGVKTTCASHMLDDFIPCFCNSCRYSSLFNSLEFRFSHIRAVIFTAFNKCFLPKMIDIILCRIYQKLTF